MAPDRGVRSPEHPGRSRRTRNRRSLPPQPRSPAPHLRGLRRDRSPACTSRPRPSPARRDRTACTPSRCRRREACSVLHFQAWKIDSARPGSHASHGETGTRNHSDRRAPGRQTPHRRASYTRRPSWHRDRRQWKEERADAQTNTWLAPKAGWSQVRLPSPGSLTPESTTQSASSHPRNVLSPIASTAPCRR